MGDVIDAISKFQKKSEPSFTEMVVYCTDELLANWEKFAQLNQLNEFFCSNVAYTKSEVNYLQDLNEIAALERRHGLAIGVWMPDVLAGPKHMGWKAGFVIHQKTVLTPDMPYETYARCFNLLLFQKLKRVLLQHGYNV